MERLDASDDLGVLFFWSLLKIIVVTVVLLLGVAYTVLLERKLVGRIQNRWGPSRVGPFGLLQPLVDGAKNFLKEDLIPTAAFTGRSTCWRRSFRWAAL